MQDINQRYLRMEKSMSCSTKDARYWACLMIFQRWNPGRIQIQPKSLLLGFTDGLSELEDEKGEQIEVEGLQKIVENASDLDGLKRDLINRVDQLKAGSGISDDITFVTLAFLP